MQKQAGESSCFSGKTLRPSCFSDKADIKTVLLPLSTYYELQYRSARIWKADAGQLPSKRKLEG